MIWINFGARGRQGLTGACGGSSPEVIKAEHSRLVVIAKEFGIPCPSDDSTRRLLRLVAV